MTDRLEMGDSLTWRLPRTKKASQAVIEKNADDAADGITADAEGENDTGKHGQDRRELEQRADGE